MNRTERLQAAERVRTGFTSRLAKAGFTRGKTSWWYRLREERAELVHLLLYRGQDLFRAYGAIRVLNDPFPAVDLNGPVSQDEDLEHLGFGQSDEAVRECVDECEAYAKRVLLPWFESWDLDAILRHRNPPFSVRSTDALLDALAGRGEVERRVRSLKLFGAPVRRVAADPKKP